MAGRELLGARDRHVDHAVVIADAARDAGDDVIVDVHLPQLPARLRVEGKARWRGPSPKKTAHCALPCPLTAPTIGELRTIEPFWNDQ
jgi:hypothetical protein